MDFLGLVFTPTGVVNLFASAVASGAAAGVFSVLVTLFYGRRGPA